MTYYKFNNVSDFNNWNESTSITIKAGSDREFDIYTSCREATTGDAVYGVVDDDFINIATASEINDLLTLEEAIADGMVVEEE